MFHTKNCHLETRVVYGPTGSRGLVGPTGHIGYRGRTGSTGPTGHTGCTGPIGIAGKDGKDGKDGSKGDIGPIGNGAGLFNLVSAYSDIEYPTGNSIRKTANNYVASIVMTAEQYRVLVFTFEAPVNASNAKIGLHRSNNSENLFCHSIQFLSNAANIILNENDLNNEMHFNNILYTAGDIFSFIIEETRLTLTKNGSVLYDVVNLYPSDFFKGAFRISTTGHHIKNISFGYLSTGQTGPSGVAQIGSMIYYVGSDDPSGWLRCDGRSLVGNSLLSNLSNMLQGTLLPNMPQIKDICDNAVNGSYIIKY
jgi:hypothetical protein